MKEKLIHFLKAKGYYLVLGIAVLMVGTVSLLSYRASQQKLSKEPIGEEGRDVEKIKEDIPDDRKNQSAEKEQKNTKTPAPQVAPLEYAAPIKGEIIAHYSPDQPLYSYTLKDWRIHNGIDIAAEAGSVVSNVAEGIVESAGADDLLGNLVVVRHTDGKISRYANLDKINVQEGQTLKKSDPIGTIGQTMLLECGETAHLHYELWSEDRPTDPSFLFEE